MPPAKHALLGASSAHRWLHCTPSAKWEAEMAAPPSSEAAEEGTLAHALAEDQLQRWLTGQPMDIPEEITSNPLYAPSMMEYVSVYVVTVLQTLKDTPGGVLHLETKVDYGHLVPGGYGTCDAMILGEDGHLHILDLKYGKGVPVDAQDNPQLRLYALGALAELSILYDIAQVTMHIIQPRLDSVTQETLTVAQLMEWGETYVKPRAALAAKGEGEHVAGDHCRWCRCKPVCRAHAEARLAVARYRFDDFGEERKPPEMDVAEIAQILQQVDDLISWGKVIKDYALDQAVNHQAYFPGWKLVEGRANRVITNEADAIQRLTDAKYPMEAITELRGITALEKLVGAKWLGELLEGLIIKPQGKPTLVPESDKRPPISTNNPFTPIKD